MDLPEAKSTIGVICTVCEQDAISLSHSVDPLSLRKIVRTPRSFSESNFNLKCTRARTNFVNPQIKISGKWSVHSRLDRHTRAQCSHASVGLAQARPNYQHCIIYHRHATMNVPT